ncbi:uncharacterized [Tachysurus ichikawai]
MCQRELERKKKSGPRVEDGGQRCGSDGSVFLFRYRGCCYQFSCRDLSDLFGAQLMCEQLHKAGKHNQDPATQRLDIIDGFPLALSPALITSGSAERPLSHTRFILMPSAVLRPQTPTHDHIIIQVLGET